MHQTKVKIRKIKQTTSAKMNKGNANKNFLDITSLIRSIQRSEGFTDCFRKGILDCDQIDCKWWSMCLEGDPVLTKDGT